MLPEKTWKTESVLLLLLGIFGTWLLGGLAVQALVKFNPDWSQSKIKLLSMVIITVSFHGVSFLWVAWFLKREKILWADAFGFRSPGLRQAVGLAVLAAIVVLPLALGLQKLSAWVMTLSNFQPEIQAPVRELQSVNISQFQRIYLAVIALIAAPLVEEVIFRGILYPTIKQAGFPKLALWLTSILFALSHENAAAFLPLLFFAIVLTMLYEKTGNLLTPIIAHSSFNIFNFLLLLWGKPLFEIFN
jgi:membrane protease YdiL (CAAX protease family)